MQRAKKFIFVSQSVDRAESRAVFSYATELESGERIEFSESLTFPFPAEAWDRIDPFTLDAALRSLHLVLGLSYWKAHCAPEMVLDGFSFTLEQAEFWNRVYTDGMGEFYFKNKIDFRGLVNFPSSADVSLRGGSLTTDEAISVEPTEIAALPSVARNDTRKKCLVPLGGGKDSLVTVEMLREQGIDLDLFTLGTSLIQQRTAEVVGKSPLVVQRVLDSRLLELNKTGEVYNGHVPITSVYVFTGVLSALLGGYGYVVFSNERSASEGNLEYLGQDINHQWSKSLEAEELFAAYVHEFITSDVTPFSLLRPLSEYAIVERFTHYPKYLPVFSSCNRNFVVGSIQPRSDRGAYWCGGCPKCAFVFSMLAAFLPKQEVVGIFGKDLFADANLLQLFKDLLGRGTCKPFECVGTADEMAVALNRAQFLGEYKDEPIMEYFASEVLPGVKDIDRLEHKLLTPVGVEELPEAFRDAINNMSS